MWLSLKKHVGLLTNLVADYSVVLKMSQLSIQPSSNLTTNSTIGKSLKLAAVYSGVSKHLTNPQIEKGIVGEDAFFVASRENCDTLGVADGVGGWANVGVDPSIFSSNLMKQCKRFVQQNEPPMFKKMDLTTPVKILKESYNSLIESKDESLVGSATACILVFDQENHNLISANLGDSGYVVIRNEQIIHRSIEQQHYFNCPYQLALYPKNFKDVQQDKPESAYVSSFQLNEGDLICLATDGLWDNLSDRSLLHLVNTEIKNFNDLTKMADKIVEKTVKHSLDDSYLSPFAINARQNQSDYIGGKPDDITVILALVVKSN